MSAFGRRRKLEQSIDASIELDNFSPSYSPGETLHGVIKRIHDSTESTSKTVNLNLVGRIDTKITHITSGDNPNNHYYASTDFYTQRLCLYQGPVKNGLNTWPFTITIPSFLEQDGLRVAVPSSYACIELETIDLGFRDYLTCEWYLEAEIYDASKTNDREVSVFPLFVRVPPTGADVPHEVRLTSTCLQEVRALQLDPQFAGQSLSFRQHMQGIFQRSTLPHFAYAVNVAHAAVMQINHPAYIPLRIFATPDHHNTKPPSTLEKLPPLKLLSMTLHFQHCTRVQNLEGCSYAAESETHWIDWTRLHWELDSKNAPPIPYIEQDSESGIDIGHHFQLRLSWQGVHNTGLHKASRKDKLVKAQVWPTTESHYMSIKHQLAWTVKVKCAGKTHKLRGETPLIVLGPSLGWESDFARQVGLQGLLTAHKRWANDATIVLPAIAFDTLST